MKENSVNHAMNTIFSIDDFSDSFLSSSPSPPPPATVPAQFHAFSMNRCQSSEWVDKFLEEVTGNPSAIASLSVKDHTIPGVVDPSALSRSSVSSAEGIGNDDVGEIKKPCHDQPFASPLNPCSSAIDSDEYRAYLKSKLDLACAAVALRAPPVNPEYKSSLIENKKQAAKTSELRSQASVNASAAADIVVTQHKANVSAAADIVATQHKANGGLLAKPANQSKSGAQVRQSTSGSSRDDSDEDELDGDTETTAGFDQLDEKRARRMLSNRESARRSRRRKQAHLTDLETQAGQLRVENSSLLKGLTEMSQKYDEAAVNNRILKADIETLRVKVKMAEETVKRETGLNPLLLARPDVPSVGMPLVNNPMDASTNAAVPMLPNPTQFFHNQVPSIRTVAPIHGRLDGGFPGNPKLPAVGMGNSRSDSEGENMTETSTLQHTVSLDHVPQQIGHRVSPSRAVPGWDSELPRAGAKDNK